MTIREVLLARLDALLAQCNATEKAIRSDGIDASLYRRAAEDFLNRIRDERTKVTSDRSRIEQGEVDGGAWGGLHGREEECSRLFRECLAFLQAARARGQDVDADLCEIADALLDELATVTQIGWKRFTVLGDEENFRDFAQIIRLRFPFCGVWDLPVSAHEFGHFVAGRLNLARPDGSHYLAFQDYKEDFRRQRAGLGDEWIFYLEEYFADVFATYVLGPAYACTCLLLRFDPVAASRENDKRHPSYAKRTYAILETLRRMNMEKDSKGEFTAAAELLRRLWDEAVASAGQPGAMGEETLISGVISICYEFLKSGAGAARFNRWKTASVRGAWLKEAEPPAEAKGAEMKISDLLNTAWVCRLQPKTDLDRVNRNTIRLCRMAA